MSSLFFIERFRHSFFSIFRKEGLCRVVYGTKSRFVFSDRRNSDGASFRFHWANSPLLLLKEVPKTDSSKIRVLNVTNSRGSEQKGCLSDYLIYKFDTYEKE